MPKTNHADAVALLKADHENVAALFEKFEAAKSAERKKDLADEICLELTVHTKIEEDIFYPACKDGIDDDLWHEAYVEHDGAKVMIAEIEAGKPGDEFYDAKMKVLSEQIKHHVKEEEKRAVGMFAQAKEAGLDMAALGARMMEEKKTLLAQYKTSGLPKPPTPSFTGTKLA
jgi:hemerythrin superfamily protein